MAAGDVLWNFGSWNAVTISDLNSLADGEAAVSAQIDLGAAPRADILECRLVVNYDGSNTPTDDAGIEVYFSRYVNSKYAGGVTAGSQDSGDALEMLQKFATQVDVRAAVGHNVSEEYVFDFDIHGPGDDLVIIVVNQSGATFNSTGNDLRYRTKYANVAQS